MATRSPADVTALAELCALDRASFLGLVRGLLWRQGYTVFEQPELGYPGYDFRCEHATAHYPRAFVRCFAMPEAELAGVAEFCQVLRHAYGSYDPGPRLLQGVAIAQGFFCEEASALARAAGCQLIDGSALLALLGARG